MLMVADRHKLLVYAFQVVFRKSAFVLRVGSVIGVTNGESGPGARGFLWRYVDHAVARVGGDVGGAVRMST